MSRSILMGLEVFSLGQGWIGSREWSWVREVHAICLNMPESCYHLLSLENVCSLRAKFWLCWNQLTSLTTILTKVILSFLLLKQNSSLKARKELLLFSLVQNQCTSRCHLWQKQSLCYQQGSAADVVCVQRVKEIATGAWFSSASRVSVNQE